MRSIIFPLDLILALVGEVEGGSISCYSCDWDEEGGCTTKALCTRKLLVENCTVCRKLVKPYQPGILAAAAGDKPEI